MLVQNNQDNYKQGDVIVIVTTQGDEIIARMDEETMSSYKVKKPANVVFGQTQDGKQGIDLQPPMYSMDLNSSVEIFKNCVKMIAKPREDMKNAYISATTNIAVADAGALDGLKGSPQG